MLYSLAIKTGASKDILNVIHQEPLFKIPTWLDLMAYIVTTSPGRRLCPGVTGF